MSLQPTPTPVVPLDDGGYISGQYMRTFTGRKVDPLNFTADDIDIEDIAHALARQCRYNGHSFGHLSVARHCLWVSERLGDVNLSDLMLTGLLHDAAEAYTGDLIRPLKHRPELAAFIEVEGSIEAVLAEHFGIDLDHPAVKQADVWVMTHVEVAARQSYIGSALNDRQAFLNTYYELGGK